MNTYDDVLRQRGLRTAFDQAADDADKLRVALDAAEQLATIADEMTRAYHHEHHRAANGGLIDYDRCTFDTCQRAHNTLAAYRSGVKETRR